MKRRRILLIVCAFFVMGTAWVHVRSGVARDEALSITKPERYYSIKLSNKLDEVLANQKIILQELKEIKTAIKR